jgi:hypothetical protein
MNAGRIRRSPTAGRYPADPIADLGIDLDSMKEKIKMVATLKKPT